MSWYAKAVAAGVVTFGAQFTTAMVDNALTWQEVAAAVVAGLVAGASVFVIPNDERDGS